MMGIALTVKAMLILALMTSFVYTLDNKFAGLAELGLGLWYGNEKTYERINTWTVKDSIQNGIHQSDSAMSEMAERDVLLLDFMTVETARFTSSGTVTDHGDFTFKTYAPFVFRRLRDLLGIKPDSYVSSFRDSPPTELASPGASGQVFYLTHDDKYMVKTLQRKEAVFLRQLLPGYYLYLYQNPHTILPRFFGLHCYKCNLTTIRTVVMNNLLPSRLKIHEKYDLKGSTYNRAASEKELAKKSPTLKDLDFMDQHPDGILLESSIYNTLVSTIRRDCRFLESFQIMDYSLLLGIHRLDPDNKESVLQDENGRNAVVNVENVYERRISLFDKNRPLTGFPAKRANGENILLFVGIIDVLQRYRLTKRLEHLLKSLTHDGNTISVANPAFYSQRFQNFMFGKVFRELPSQRLGKRKREEEYKKGEEGGE